MNFFSIQILSFILLHETDLEHFAICTSTAVIVIKLLCDSANILFYRYLGIIYPTTYTQNNLSTTHIYYNIFSDPPGAPNITGIASTTPLIENQVRRISCISIAGNPLAELKWFRGNEELTGAVLGNIYLFLF